MQPEILIFKLAQIVLAPRSAKRLAIAVAIGSSGHWRGPVAIIQARAAIDVGRAHNSAVGQFESREPLPQREQMASRMAAGTRFAHA